MRKSIFHIALLLLAGLGTVACKNEAQNRVSPDAAKEASSASESSTVYEVDPEASTINWRGTKPTGEHVGYINIESGTFTALDNEIESGNIVIDMNSLTVTDEGISDEGKTNLENHLKGTVEGKETDFFNVRKYPTATFEITGVSQKEGQQQLQGNLTIKEDSKNIEFPVTIRVNGDELHISSETFTLDRTDWNVNYGSRSVFDNLGNNFISDDMELSIDVKATRAN